MKGLDANTQKYELAEIDHNVVLFTNMRLDRDTVPEGIFCYDVRDSDNLDGSMAQIKKLLSGGLGISWRGHEPFGIPERNSRTIGGTIRTTAIRRRNDHAAMNILPLEGEVMRHEQFYFMGWREESTPQPDLYHVPCKF